MSYTIIHISDLHLYAYPKTWGEWTSKRFLGAMNLWVRRARQYPLKRFKALVQHIQQTQWNHLVISGDLTSLGLEREFYQARSILDPLLSSKKRVSIIPGNHDRYVKEACDPDLFSMYFGEWFSTDEIKTEQINNKWHLISWDSTHPNDWLTAAGTVRHKTFLATEEYIKAQSPDAKFIIMNHYPIWFPKNYHFHARHELYNLYQTYHWVLRQPAVSLYLHGHVHHNWTHKINRNGNPLYIVNSASSTRKATASGPSSFHKIILQPEEIIVKPVCF